MPSHAVQEETNAIQPEGNVTQPADSDRNDEIAGMERLFALEVLPILKSKCFACHGDNPDDIKGELDMTSLEGLLRGGESGDPAMVIGNLDESPMIEAIRWDGLEMPPKENDRLSDEQIEMVELWVANGAAWPSVEKQKQYQQEEWKVTENEDGVIMQTSGGLADEWTYRRYSPEDMWAFRTVTKPAVREGTNPVDYFIDRRLKEAGFVPAPEADPNVLVRRVYLDLIGLPPTPDQRSSFLAEWEVDADKAWSDLIDQLLESPHYGERWAQHWLDVARYADTGGYSNDYERSNAWRYRDYVIRAFNSDKPYDQFVVEQLAGDELADHSVRQRRNGDEGAVEEARFSGQYTDEEAEMLVATGFLRMGPWDNAMVKSPEARQIYLDDVVNSVGQTFLATTMRCLKCHDHKFDPIPTRDYYRMYATFAGTQMAERPVAFQDCENRNGFEEGRAYVQRLLDYATQEKDRLKEKQEAAAKAWYAERGKEYVPENERQELPDEEKPPRHVGLDYVDEGQLKVREQDEWIWKRSLERFEPMIQGVYYGEDYDYAWDGARRLRIKPSTNKNWTPTTHILMGGSISAPGAEVGPGVLSAIGLPVPSSQESKTDPYVIDSALPGRRLTFARWVAHPDNPLTTRAIVNRIWQYHFGYGIARNPNNFGAKGAKPSHPELLDWLAADFVDGGWTFKRMHRTILMSHAYRRASLHAQQEELQISDPNNELLAYFPRRRLSAEEIRDGILLMTGELNPEMGGLPVMPEINMEVALQPRMIQFSIAPAYQPSRFPEQRNRRTIYAYRVRGQADPFLELFNQPNPNDSCEMRDSAAVSPQVFTLLNSDTMTDRSIAMAARLQSMESEASNQIEQAFAWILGRMPTQDELTRLTSFMDEMSDYHSKKTPLPPTYPTQITRSLVEEFSGKTFEYEEILPVFEDYQPDLKPNQTDAKTRALADLCLLLFNTNEFMYVD